MVSIKESQGSLWASFFPSFSCTQTEKVHEMEKEHLNKVQTANEVKASVML